MKELQIDYPLTTTEHNLLVFISQCWGSVMKETHEDSQAPHVTGVTVYQFLDQQESMWRGGLFEGEQGEGGLERETRLYNSSEH